MARGGARSGKPGANYTNRSDLQNAPRLAPTAQTNQPYGEAGAQLSRQQEIPLTPPQGPPPPPLNSPSARPGEPVQSGLSLGAGPGPEGIPALTPNPGPDPDLINLAPYLPGLELLSTLPTASSTTRNFVRRLRGALPPEM